MDRKAIIPIIIASQINWKHKRHTFRYIGPSLFVYMILYFSNHFTLLEAMYITQQSYKTNYNEKEMYVLHK